MENSGVWHAAVHGVTRVRHYLATEQQQVVTRGEKSAGQCRRHMGSIPHIVEQPSPHALEPGNHNCRAHIWQLLKPACPRAHATQQEKLLQWEAHVPQLESSP